MKKTIFTILLLLFSLTNYAQDSPDGTLEIIPPSPTPFQFTKYGDVAINESSGKIAPSIPLYSFKAGKLSIPINLSYAGNGVKVDQLSSWTGINWNLVAGGAITRTVIDRPDEQSFGSNRVLHTIEELSNMDITEGSDDAIYLNSLESTKIKDTQADNFSFSFPGYSGSFYLDEELEPVVANYDKELDIIISGQDGDNEITELTIIAPDGIRYFFGGAYGVERTQSNPNVLEARMDANTTYYLYKIIHPSGDIIEFEYGQESEDYEIRISQSQHINKAIAGSGMNCPPQDDLDYIDSDMQFQRIFQGKYLSKISSDRSNFEIKFISDLAPSDYSYRRILNEIQVVEKEDNSKIIEKIDLYYIKSSERSFLEKVKFNGNQTVLNGLGKPYEYTMEYNSPEDLPDRLSFKQDHLGYFNNKNNITLLPKIDEEYALSYLNSSLADREPDFEFALKGALMKINYPTGGYTEFEYEAPKVKTPDIRRIHLKSYCGQEIQTPNELLTDYYTIGNKIDELGNVIPIESQTIDVKINVNTNGNLNSTHYFVYARAIDIETNIVQERVFNLEPDEIYNYDRVFSFDLVSNHTYKIEIELEPDPSHGSDTYPYKPVYVNAFFEYQIGYKNINGLGIRIKKVLDYPDKYSDPIIKRYYYKKITEIENEYEDLIAAIDPVSYIYVTDNLHCCEDNTNGNGAGGNARYLYENLQSSTVNFIFPSSDNAWLYRYVTISYGGENFEMGGVQKEFLTRPAENTQHFFGVSQFYNHFNNQRSNIDILNNRLESELILKKTEDNELYKTKEIHYEYFEDDTKFITNNVIKRPYYYCEWFPNYTNVDGLYIGIYRTYSIKNYLQRIISKEYIDPVPIDETNESSYKKIIKEQNFTYGDLVGLPITTTVTTSLSDKIHRTNTYYPNQWSELSDNMELEPFCSYFDIRHMFSLPIQTETYLEDVSSGTTKKLSTIRNLYNMLGLPVSIKTSMADNPLETKINYQYDLFGNLSSVAKPFDNLTKYLWGYNNSYPIAKIETPAIELNEEGEYNESFPANFQELVTAAQLASNNDIDEESEEALRTALNSLREAIPESFVTSYTYNPGEGITSIIDPNGKISWYNYDKFGRLKNIKDDQQNILKYYDYRYNQKVEYEISTSGGEFGQVQLSNSTVSAGESCIVTILPNLGYHITGFTINGVSKFDNLVYLNEKDRNYTIENIQEDQNISVTFTVNSYTISASKSGDGIITPTGNSQVEYGNSISYAFTPSAGYHIKDVKVDGLSVGNANSYTFENVDSDHNILVEFEINSYVVTSTRNNNYGNITPLGNSNVEHGSDITFTISPVTGSFIKDVKVNGSSVGAKSSHTISNVTSNQAIDAEFELHTYTIIANKTGSGSINPSGTTTVNYFSRTKYDFTPASGYYIEDVQIDGASLGAITTYTFEDVLSNKNLQVIFERDNYLDVSLSSMGFGIDGGIKTFTILSNVNWTVSSNVSWLTITPQSGSNSTTISVNCSRSRNLREGVITISGGGFTRTINVSQPTL